MYDGSRFRARAWGAAAVKSALKWSDPMSESVLNHIGSSNRGSFSAHFQAHGGPRHDEQVGLQVSLQA